MPDILVCRKDEVAEGQTRIIRSGDVEIGVIRYKDEWYAYRNLCPHQGGPACEGVRMLGVREMIGAGGVSLGQTYDEDDMHIVCPWHGYEFHLSNGEHVRDSRIRLQRFDIVEKGDDVYVSL
jgi:nitrite reductase (NADH) small subunit